MKHVQILVGVALVLCCFASVSPAHPGHARRKPGVAAGDGAIKGAVEGAGAREADVPDVGAAGLWIASNGAFRERGTFVMARGDVVQVRRDDDSLVSLPRALLRGDDERWVVRRMHEIRLRAEREGFAGGPSTTPAGIERLVPELLNLSDVDDSDIDVSGIEVALPLLLAQRTSNEKGRAVESPQAATLSAAFAPFEKLKAVKTRSDDRWFYVESNGVPDHRMMVGITAWQQQVPLPQKYAGENAWQIPLHPVPAKTPATTKNRFLRGAIAVAVNGIPIFNPLNNRGDDAFLFGELDEFGGHCGRADDYHYHLAPVHLEKTVGKGKPIAYALDGYPIYGYEEPDGSPVKNLDALNGHKDKDGNYHYHATKTYPYLNGGFFGEVTERGGQVDPQPRAEPIRPDLRPLRDAKIVDFTETKPKSYRLTYEVRGKKGTVAYTLSDDGSAKFTFTDTDGRSTTETYSPRRRGPRGGGDRDGDDRPPPRPDGKRPPPRDDKRPPRREDDPPPRANDKDSAPRGTASGPATDRPKLAVTSGSLDAAGNLAVECSCDGAGVSPAVAWKDAPKGTKSFALSLWHTAPDQEKSYWVVYDIPADVTKLEKNVRNIGTVGLNDKRRNGYDAMCSKGPGAKTYHITIWALSAKPRLPADKATRAELLNAVRGITLAEGTLDFTFERKR